MEYESGKIKSFTDLRVCQLIIAKDIGYIEEEQFKNLAEQTIVLNKMMNGLIKSSKARNL